MQARFYMPGFGRFLSTDPALDQHFEDTQSWNIYSYVRNNPIMSTDPTGMVADDKKDEKKADGTRPGPNDRPYIAADEVLPQPKSPHQMIFTDVGSALKAGRQWITQHEDRSHEQGVMAYSLDSGKSWGFTNAQVGTSTSVPWTTLMQNDLPKGAMIGGLLHTHPGGSSAKITHSGNDNDAPLNLKRFLQFDGRASGQNWSLKTDSFMSIVASDSRMGSSKVEIKTFNGLGNVPAKLDPSKYSRKELGAYYDTTSSALRFW